LVIVLGSTRCRRPPDIAPQLTAARGVEPDVTLLRLLGGVVAIVLVATGVATDAAFARDTACGEITIHYSYGDYRFKVVVTQGPVRCTRARRVMRKGIPATTPDPRGWYCRQARGRRFSDVCINRRPRRDRVVKARYLGQARTSSGVGLHAQRDFHRCKIPPIYASSVFKFRSTTNCREARRVLRNRRCAGPPCKTYVSRGRAGRYRCRVDPNQYEGANWSCRHGRRIVRFQTRAGATA
jgi:hypothetical protein